MTTELDGRLRAAFRAIELPPAPPDLVEQLDDLPLLAVHPVIRRSRVSSPFMLAAASVVLAVAGIALVTSLAPDPGPGGLGPVGESPPATPSATPALPGATLRPGTPRITGGMLVRIDASTGAIQGVVPTGPHPGIVTTAGGRVWTMNFGDGTLSRIDPTADGPSTTITFAGDAVGIAADGDDVWVAVDDHDVVRLDGATGIEEARLRVTDETIFRLRDAGFIAVTDDSLWLTVPDLRIRAAPHGFWRIDPETGEVEARLSIDRDPHPPLVYDGSIFVISFSQSTLTRIDPATNAMTVVRVGNEPVMHAAGDGSIWIGHGLDKVVWRVNPDSLETQSWIRIGEPVRGLAFGAGRIWVTTPTSLHEIDPSTNAVVASVRLLKVPMAFSPAALTVLDGAVWVAID
jgi:sugar lactone lactonase YvrE